MVSEKLLNNRIRIILLVSAVLLFTAAGFLLALSYYWYAGALILSGLIIILTINRIYNITNESITVFFDALRNDDTAVHFSTDINNRTLTGLYESMNSLNKHFQDIKIRNEYNESYYRNLIQHASTGLLVIDSKNSIELINKAACRYAGIPAESTNTNLLKIRHPAFYEAVCKIKPGENVIYRNLNSGDLQLLFFRASIIRRKDTDLKLVSIQDIRYELESRELESYRKLISVMTHEIMNLLSPLTSVSRELYSMYRKNNKFIGLQELDESYIKTTVNGLQLINDQSKGLMNFVNNYRKLSKIPQPEFTTFPADEWAEQLKIAFSGKMAENNIDFRVNADKSCGQVIADKNLLNQVMINLVNNAFDAVMENEGERRIEINLMKNIHDRYVIKVINNGPVIEPELLEKIFVPFFTTKKNGSGIGLSISQEIMKRHNGSVVAISTKETPACFILEF